MTHRSSRELFQRTDSLEAKDSGESLIQAGAEALVGLQARVSKKRNGTPAVVETQYPRDHGQHPKKIMGMSEREIKEARPPLILAQAKVCKKLRNPERVKQ